VPIESPDLDDLRYSRILEELVRRIPVYAPQWTNHNDADPGIALLQLFAYLAEQIGYRLNRVPEKAEVELLKLLGIRLMPARAATSSVAFFLSNPAVLNGFTIDAGSTLTRRAATPVGYETDTDLDVVPAEVAIWLATKNPFVWDLLRLDDAGNTEPVPADADLPAKIPTADCAWMTIGWDGNKPRAADMPLAPVPLLPTSAAGVAHPWLWVGLQFNDRRDAGFVGIEVELHVVLNDDEVPTETYDARCAPVVAAGELAPPPVSWLGYFDAVSGAVKPVPGRIVDTTNQFGQSGTVKFTIPFSLGAPSAWANLRDAVVPTAANGCIDLTNALKAHLGSTGTVDLTGFQSALASALSAAEAAIVTPKPAVGHPLDATYRDPTKVPGWLRIGPLPAGRDTAAVRHLGFNVVGITQATTVINEVLGTADGRPAQTYRMAHTNVLKGTLSLGMAESADANAVLTTWTEVESLDPAGPFDRVFELDAEAGVVTFGDGERGAIPPLVPQAGAIVALLYHYGGGLSGECGPATINQIAVQATGLVGVVNVVAARGGADAETLDHAELRARKELSSRCRAVTRSDFEWITLQTPTVRVGRAIVVPRRRPLPTAPTQADGAASAWQACCPPVRTPAAIPSPDGCLPCLPTVDPSAIRFAPAPGSATMVGASNCGPELPVVAGLDDDFEAPGVVTVVAVPDRAAVALPLGSEILPTPSFLRIVCLWLDAHRLVTTEVYAVPPQYCRLCDVYVRVVAKPGYSRLALQELVASSLAAWVDVLSGGPDGTGAPFGGQVHVADLIARVFRTEGVDGVEEFTSSFARTKSNASPRQGRLVRCPTVAGEYDSLQLGAEETTSLELTTFTLETR
jgi:hypothetical protein